jgi:hypothetical protein
MLESVRSNGLQKQQTSNADPCGKWGKVTIAHRSTTSVTRSHTTPHELRLEHPADRRSEIPEWRSFRDLGSWVVSTARLSLSPRRNPGASDARASDRPACFPWRKSETRSPNQSAHRYTNRQRSIITKETQSDLGYYPSTKSGQVHSQIAARSSGSASYTRQGALGRSSRLSRRSQP